MTKLNHKKEWNREKDEALETFTTDEGGVCNVFAENFAVAPVGDSYFNYRSLVGSLKIKVGRKIVNEFSLLPLHQYKFHLYLPAGKTVTIKTTGNVRCVIN